MERLTREMTFEEEYTFLKKEVKELFDKEDRKSEPPESHCVVRRALRCIKKLFAELEPYKEYKDLEEQGLMLRLPVKIGDTVYIISRNNEIIPLNVYGIDIRKDDFTILTKNEKYCGYSISSLLGKYESIDWFLTKEEAEQQLKEIEKD